MIHVSQLAPIDQWDQNIIDRLLAGMLYPTGLDFTRHTGYWPGVDGIILMIPGRYWAERTTEISEALQPYRWVLGIRTSDEEDLFDPAAVTHPNIAWWVQTPRPERDYGPTVRRFFGVGFPPHFNDLPAEAPHKDIGVFLAGQNTHERRHLAFRAIANCEDACTLPTPGFTQGMDSGTYAANMQAAKVAPCPAGPVTADTFRVWEALEAHALPVIDTMSPAWNHHGYWDRVLPGSPVTLYSNPRRLPALIDGLLGDPEQGNRIAAWWIQFKREMAACLVKDLRTLGAI